MPTKAKVRPAIGLSDLQTNLKGLKKGGIFPLAIFCSDIHLCHARPAARMDPNWYDAMGYYLDQLTSIQTKCSKNSAELCPVIIAGDLFDKWNSPAELIMFAIDHLPPDTYAIPGQHDLPYHNASLLNKSAYGLLDRVDLGFTDLSMERMGFIASRRRIGNILLVSFPYEPSWPDVLNELEREEMTDTDLIRVAVIHKYAWLSRRNAYDGVSEESLLSEKLRRQLSKKYHWCVFGDNHKGFVADGVLNCGTFMRRKADEISYRPQVGILMSDASMLMVYLDVDGDVFHEPLVKMTQKGDVDMASVVEMLQEIQSEYVDFRELLKRALRDEGTSQNVARIVRDIIDKR